MKRTTKNTWFASGVTAALLAGTIAASAPASAAGPEVGSAIELKAAVEALGPGAATVTLAAGFEAVATPPTITIPAGVALTLDGNGATVTKQAGSTGRHLNFTGNGSEPMVITDVTFQGPNDADPVGQAGGTPGGGLGINNVPTLSVSDSTFAGIDSSAGLALSGVTTLTVSRSSFMGNRAAAGAAIDLPNGVNATITDTTMHKNWGTQAGYSGGALRPQRGTNLTIERSVFSGNGSLTRGGAIAFHQMEGSLTVRDSVFDGNTVPESSYNPSMHDGGAIAVSEVATPNLQTGTTLITGTTFVNNSASDEGGALLLQSGNGSKATIINSTFFNNSSYGKQPTIDDSSGGGAIEAFGTALTLELTTFVNNLAYKGTTLGHQRGGAVSATGDQKHLTAQPLTLSRNLFVGNDVVANNGTPAVSSLYRQVSARGGIETLEGTPDTSATEHSPDEPEFEPGDRELVVPDRAANPADQGDDFLPFANEELTRTLNVGIDNGTKLDDGVTRLAVLGTDAPKLAPNGNPIVAGDPRTGLAQTPGTIVFHPRDDGYFAGLADNIGEALAGQDPPTALPVPSVTEDQRRAPLDQPADAGALQQAFIRFDPNGGDWPEYTPSAFDGSRIVQRDAAAVVWAVAAVGAELPSEPAPDAAPAGTSFAGWNTEPDGSGLAYPAGTFTVPAGNLRLYAIWKPQSATQGSVTAHYVDERGAQLRDPVVHTGDIGASYVTERLKFAGYDFVRVVGAASGQFETDPATVTYEYRKQSGPTPPPIVNPPSTGGLADSGSPAAGPLLAAAAALLLVAAGAFLSLRRRR
ncbi:MucBP domain-containing protein [Leucobacter albus]|uniref:MucBP domain-containing protein n=1 Tax=Leucobacter albus TaxID=272210 RepID=A0ABW3TM59_9MICO